MGNPTTLPELVAHLNEKADAYDRYAAGLVSPIMAGEWTAKAETARWAARLAAGIECGKDAA